MAKKEFSPVFIKDVDGVRIKTPVGILCFPALVKPDTEGKFATGKFKATLVWPKSADRSLLVAACKAAAAESFPGVEYKELLRPFRDGNEKYEEDPVKNKHFKDCWYITPKSKQRPTLLDSSGQPIELENLPEILYGGCKAQFILTACTYEQKKEKGVTFLLDGIKQMGNGKRLGGGGANADDFDDAGGDDEGEDDE